VGFNPNELVIGLVVHLNYKLVPPSDLSMWVSCNRPLCPAAFVFNGITLGSITPAIRQPFSFCVRWLPFIKHATLSLGDCFRLCGLRACCLELGLSSRADPRTQWWMSSFCTAQVRFQPPLAADLLMWDECPVSEFYSPS